MCGRVDIHTPPSQLARLLEVQLASGVDPDGRPSWNVPPARGIPAITERHARSENGAKTDDHERVMDVLRWGLVPHWAKDPRTGYKMINARAETVTKKPAYRSAFANHRCLIVVDGFFEWQVPDPGSPKRKRPFDGLRAPDWVVLEGILATVEAGVVDLACRYAQHCLDIGDASGAEWSARQGLRVSPYDERLYRLLMQASDVAGNPAGVESTMAELVHLVADDVEPFDAVHPETIALYRRLSRRTFVSRSR